MGVLWPVFVLGCGPVHLGHEQTHATDAGSAHDVDAAADIAVSVAIQPRGGCEGCFDVRATATGGRPPYHYVWEDGLAEAERRICLDSPEGTFTVTAFDADGARSAPHTTSLAPVPDAGCPAASPPTLCLQNPSFEGTPAVNLGGENSFDCPFWSACTNPAATNTPEVVNDTIQQSLAAIPAPTAGDTFLGLMEGEQVSQRLCEPLFAGEEISFQIDLSRLYIGAGVVPDTELPYLEIWGGAAAGCMPHELLWASPGLPSSFQTFCVTLRPRQFSDALFLRARTDGSLASLAYMLVDNIVPVSGCL